ncbi:MAG TPA: acyl-CoA dehydrogenase family protein, partial [Spirochaetota bacterium]|nr:acyl-CoA dehydrogenase family protein [Spirochaetota bacterium]
MDFKLTEEQQMLKDTVRQFAENELKPKAEHYDRTHEFPMEHVKKLGEMGIMGIVYPDKYNGAGMDYVSYAIAVEEVSRGDAATGTIVSAHNSLCLSPIYYFASEELKQKYLTKLTTGEYIGCFGITEPEAGSDAAGTKTTAVLENGSWVLNGTKN